MAIIRDASGLLAICGICKNSLRSIEPEPSLFSNAEDTLSWRVSDSGQRAVGSGVRDRVAAPVKLHEAFLQPFQFTGVDCAHRA